ncbi:MULTISPECIES: creatininase family protein [Hydrogenophaga]|jgi:creatinine amidohydrolase|uniref:creatininase family protein n=1 Tax=Hydrogenophaga TaxID=47420 RepID=UPI000878DE21|nr:MULTISPECIES: creatininase family protein [unclassified Hydrogenophaga]MBN9373003.1 creatininase family protein [Hydrogenophaga sp.]OJV71963.1 MAG: creatininase [Hydrogenophaga sp. 70-12]
MSAATPSSRYWQDLGSAEFAALDRGRAIAVLPVAATEQHGPHLPLSVDADIARGVIEAAQGHLPADLPALFLPLQAVGFSPEHAAFAGTLTLKADTLMRLWTELAECVADAGVKKLLIFNTHGGQVGLLDPVARDLRARRGLLVVSTSWFQLPLLDAHGQDVNARFSAHEQRFGAHAGEVETALMRVLNPGRVRMELARNFVSSSEQRAERFEILGNGRSAKFAWQAQDLNPAGAAGNAAAATAENGRALLDAAGRALAKLLVEMDRLPADTLRQGGSAG